MIEPGYKLGERFMDQLVDLLMLTGFLSALFCVLGIIAGICGWAEQKYRLAIGLVQRHPKLQHMRVWKPPVKKVVKRKTANATSNARLTGKSVRIFWSYRIDRKAA
jgi:hypothetical protein